MTATPELLTHSAGFKTTLRRQGLMLVPGIPLVLGAWVIAAQQLQLDPVFASRMSLLCAVPLLLAAIFYPLLTTLAERRRLFIVNWFLIAMFFNIWWEMPQVLMMDTFRAANQAISLDKLPYFIPWWGYTTSDLDYFNLTRYFILAEISFWVVNLLAIIGLVHMHKGREFKAMLWFCICGALQIYNVTCIFLPYGGIVEHFNNIASDSPLALAAYWIMNLMWVVAASVATRLAFVRVIELHERK